MGIRLMHKIVRTRVRVNAQLSCAERFLFVTAETAKFGLCSVFLRVCARKVRRKRHGTAENKRSDVSQDL